MVTDLGQMVFDELARLYNAQIINIMACKNDDKSRLIIIPLEAGYLRTKKINKGSSF
jgi:hypothetical protein